MQHKKLLKQNLQTHICSVLHKQNLQTHIKTFVKLEPKGIKLPYLPDCISGDFGT